MIENCRKNSCKNYLVPSFHFGEVQMPMSNRGPDAPGRCIDEVVRPFNLETALLKAS